MIPALLLNVQSHHNVLDVCAAPGSKTEQLLHIMQASRPVGSAPSSGMVVANDADPVRINTLKNRYTRCLTPNLLITCATAEELCSRIHQPVFDRILADVPCSGDGTIRKFPHIWRLFRPRMSLDLHKVQLSIAKASVDMLKVGGRMVYSTCSINPLEDESVVSALLQHYWHQGLRLVDTRAEGLLPELKSRVGLSHWRCDPDVFVVGETDDAVRKESLNRLPEIVPTMLPPSPEDAVQLNLERCHRILPQDNDTGGFFVAVLELQDCTKLDADDLTYFSRKISHKKKKLAKESLTSVNVMKELGYNPKRKQAAPVSTMRTKKEQKSQKLKKEEPSTSTVIKSPDYNTLPEDELVHFTNALDLHNSFPTMNSSGKLAECEEVCSIRMVAATVENGQEDGPMEELSLVSAGVQEALETWAQAEVGMLVHAGVPVATFSQYSPNLVSLIADGVPSLLPWMRGNSTAQLSSEDFKVLANLICEGGVTQLSVAEKESVTQKIMNSADDESMLKVSRLLLVVLNIRRVMIQMYISVLL
jgi:16S rRNA C967 or C1407 C5-methylase (RsmB/RsmF family)